MAIRAVIIKLGPQGGYYRGHLGGKEESFTVPGFTVSEVVDTVGAGDGFAVSVVSALLEGRSPREAVRRGNLPLPTIAASPLPGGDDEARVEGREQSPFGHYLTNRDGMTLDMFEQDQQGGGYSTCYESCAIAWPPYTTEASPEAGENIDEDKLATFERDDGTRQVTYAG